MHNWLEHWSYERTASGGIVCLSCGEQWKRDLDFRQEQRLAFQKPDCRRCPKTPDGLFGRYERAA